ncbi:MAG: LLM class flavin-dependent oxidoreductase, partial [Verrucomicrobia bacterium]|nr:LLM class flavin-dependent oxidoreductase [Verrucomicrobiota bacterium]
NIDETCKFATTIPASYQTDDDLNFLIQSLDTMESYGWDINKSCLNNGAAERTSTSESKNQPFPIESSPVADSGDSHPLENQVAKYFLQVLGVADMGRDQSFIELGGNSLMAMQVISRIKTNLGISIPIKVFFNKTTISGIIDYLITHQKTDEEDRSKVEKETSVESFQDLRSNRKSTMNFSLFFFSGDEGVHPEDRYKLVVDGAKFADENDFDAIWLPERHFNKFGGLYPNPAVLGAAIAATTKQIHIRGGSVVAPLHHPVRIAEEWSVLDNLSKGRVGISFGSGFHPKDFLLAPQAFPNRKKVMFDSINIIQNLWQGGRYKAQAGGGEDQSIELFPTPYSKKLPIWLSTTRSPDTFAEAGALGGNVLTALLRLSVGELAERIDVYRKAREDAGHDPDKGVVTVMLHTFVGSDMDYVRSKVEEPFKEYLRSHMEHTQAVSTEKAAGETIELTIQEKEELLDHAFNRYFETSSLMGTEEICLETIENLQSIGVDEVACLIDFGVDYDALMNSLKHLNNLRIQVNALGSV